VCVRMTPRCLVCVVETEVYMLFVACRCESEIFYDHSFHPSFHPCLCPSLTSLHPSLHPSLYPFLHPSLPPTQVLAPLTEEIAYERIQNALEGTTGLVPGMLQYRCAELNFVRYMYMD